MKTWGHLVDQHVPSLQGRAPSPKRKLVNSLALIQQTHTHKEVEIKKRETALSEQDLNAIIIQYIHEEIDKSQCFAQGMLRFHADKLFFKEH